VGSSRTGCDDCGAWSTQRPTRPLTTSSWTPCVHVSRSVSVASCSAHTLVPHRQVRAPAGQYVDATTVRPWGIAVPHRWHVAAPAPSATHDGCGMSSINSLSVHFTFPCSNSRIGLTSDYWEAQPACPTTQAFYNKCPVGCASLTNAFAYNGKKVTIASICIG